MSMFGWVLNTSKIWPKMVILPHPRYGDFYRFACILTPPFNGSIVRTKRDLFTKFGQCATEAPCQCLVEFWTNPKFDPKWWFCPTRGMAIFTNFACILTPPLNGRFVRTKRDIFTKFGESATEAHVNVWLSFKQIQNLTENGDFAPPAVWQFLPILPVF